MSSLKQKPGSRANGKLSRGPMTPEGKRNSAANAIHHGMPANSYVLSGEARESFEGILDRGSRMFMRSKRELDAQKRENAHCEANPVIDLAP
jgi:hypothetical protein